VLCVGPMKRNIRHKNHRIFLFLKGHRVGTAMGTTDTMVAGHAIAVGAVLVASNENRFSRVDGLKTENWMRPQARL
jgi:predicted nucleic acid-binding protein